MGAMTRFLAGLTAASLLSAAALVSGACSAGRYRRGPGRSRPLWCHPQQRAACMAATGTPDVLPFRASDFFRL